MNITIQSFTQLFQGCLKLAKYPNAKRLNLKDYQITARGSNTMPYRNPSLPRLLPWNLSLMIGGTERYVRAFIAGESIGEGSHLIRIASYEPGSDTTCLARIERGVRLTYRQIEFHFEWILPAGGGSLTLLLTVRSSSQRVRCANDN